MNGKRVAAAVTAALIAGVVAGNVTSGYAVTAPATTSTSTTAPAGLGLRLGAAMHDAGARLADVVAKLTGLSSDAVQDKREAGTSFADIAKSEGVSTDKVIDSSLDIRKDVLDAKVKGGTITQDQADAALDRMETRLNDRINATDDSCTGTGTGGMGGGGGRGMGGGGRGMGGGRGAGCATAQ